MPRPIWKGQVSFGLVNIPVVLYGAENRKELHFNLLDGRNRARVKYQRVNEATGEPVPWDKIVKGYELENDSYVLLSDEDFKRAAVEATQTVEIVDFVKLDDIDVMYYDKPYYLVPGNKGEKGYVLLRETLKRTKKVGLAKVVIHTRQYLAALMPVGNALVLEVLRFYDEVRKPEEFSLPAGALKDYKIVDRELDMAEKLVESMTADWEPEKYHDEYREALLKWIEHKAEAGETSPTPAAKEGEEEEPGPSVVNIADLLKRSVEQQRQKTPGRQTAAGAKRPARRKQA